MVVPAAHDLWHGPGKESEFVLSGGRLRDYKSAQCRLRLKA